MSTKHYDGSRIQPQYAVDIAFYDRIRSTKPQHRLVRRFSISPFSGKGFIVKKGQTFRIIESHGPQIATLALWNEANPREAFSAMYTWLAESIYLTVNMRLWSQMPWFVPMATCVEDTVVNPVENRHDHHHWLGTHCHSKLIEMRTGSPCANSCHNNLLQALSPFGIREADIGDSIGVFQKFRLDLKDGKKLHVLPTDAKVGDYVAFYAELDLIVGVSVCPYGDGLDYHGANDGLVRSLEIEVHDTGIEPKAFPKRTDWRSMWKGRWIEPRH